MKDLVALLSDAEGLQSTGVEYIIVVVGLLDEKELLCVILRRELNICDVAVVVVVVSAVAVAVVGIVHDCSVLSLNTTVDDWTTEALIVLDTTDIVATSEVKKELDGESTAVEFTATVLLCRNELVAVKVLEGEY